MKNIFVLLLAICIVNICVPVMAQITDLHKIRVTENIPYSQTVRIGATKTIKLCFDLYEPISDFDFDANIKRPLIIAVYGGAFVIGIGSRKNTDISTYCTNFAQLGYVAASIDYSNMSPFHISSKNLIRSAYKAVQDLSTAIRYFKANSEQYKIDTSNIFLVGSSSGSIVILHELFMKEDERPLEVFYEPYLGDIHTKGDTSLLKYSTDVRGAVV